MCVLMENVSRVADDIESGPGCIPERQTVGGRGAALVVVPAVLDDERDVVGLCKGDAVLHVTDCLDIDGVVWNGAVHGVSRGRG